MSKAGCDIRFHGTAGRYSGNYSDKMLAVAGEKYLTPTEAIRYNSSSNHGKMLTSFI